MASTALIFETTTSDAGSLLNDLPIEAKILDANYAAIRLRETKLLIVLLEASRASGWIEDEVTTTFEEQQQRSAIVLFPVFALTTRHLRQIPSLSSRVAQPPILVAFVAGRSATPISKRLIGFCGTYGSRLLDHRKGDLPKAAELSGRVRSQRRSAPWRERGTPNPRHLL